MILVDSSVWINYFNGVDSRQTDLLDLLVVREVIVIGDLILMEVLQGFKTDHDFNIAKKLFAGFVHVELAGFAAVNKSIEYYRLLRKSGITIRKTIDVIIATYCIQNKIPLLHADKDFEPFVKYCGLKII